MGAMTMDEFLGHSTRGSRGTVMKSWTKDGKVMVWLNRQSSIHCVWRHGFRKVVQLKDKEPEIWGEKFRCFEEDEEVLVNQNRRDRDTGVRQFPPTCGYCRFLEDIRQAVTKKDIGWLDPVFRFEAGNKVEIMRAGGLIGFFKSDRLTDENKAAMAAVGVYQKTAWREESRAKAEYVFCVVNDADPKAGVQMTIETAGLGDKMKRVIADQLKSRREKGDPTRNPYPFLWEYDDKASTFNEMYNVVPMIEEVPSDLVRRLIDGPGPDTSPVTRRSPSAHVRAMLQQHDVMGIDWAGYLPDDGPDQPADQPAGPVDGGSVAGPAGQQTDDEDVECDGCGKAMKAAATACPHCGKRYEVEESPKVAALPALPPPKQVPRDAPAPMASKHQVDAFAGGDDDIPF